MKAMIADARTRELLTVAEAAAVLRQSVPTVRRRIARGQLPALRVGPSGPLRVDRVDLEAFLLPARRRS
jgi:excisionase family DNA binding protein